MNNESSADFVYTRLSYCLTGDGSLCAHHEDSTAHSLELGCKRCELSQVWDHVYGKSVAAMAPKWTVPRRHGGHPAYVGERRPAGGHPERVQEQAKRSLRSSKSTTESDAINVRQRARGTRHTIPASVEYHFHRYFYNIIQPHICQQTDSSTHCPGKSLGIVGQDPSDSTSNRLHVDIFRFCFHSVEGHSIDSSTRSGKFPEVLMNFNRLFLELNQFICN